MLKNILWAKEVSRNDLGEVGGKGGNLGELINAGIPVPDAFIVTSGAYFTFIKEHKIDQLIKTELDNINPEDTKSINQASKKIQATILKKPFSPVLEGDILEAYAKLSKEAGKKDPLVAIRSSATAEDLPEASFAGQQNTYLNISGEKQVLKSVRDAFSSLFEPRSIYYRSINKFDHLKVGIAVPVQRMVQSDQSGILFTLDPITNDQSVIVIDAVLGLGEAIVSGSVSPDHFVIEKGSLAIKDKQIARQAWKMIFKGGKNIHTSLSAKEKATQKITDAQAIELARIAKQIEDHYKFPQDTEWAIENGKIFFVQSRPITTMKKKEKTVPLNVSDGEIETTVIPGAVGEMILKGVSASVGVVSGPVQIVTKLEEIETFKEGCVLVAEMTNPSYVPAMKKAVAIVTDAGGMTSHAAIISRELGIPAIVGTGQATHKLKDGQIITVDGAKAMVYKGKISGTAVKDSHVSESSAPQEKPMSGFIEEVPVTGTKVYVNLAEPSEAKRVAELPVDGVGLLRAEFMIAGLGEHPKAMVEGGRAKKFVEELQNGILEIANAFKPRPVVYRATDFKTNEYRGLKGGEKYEPKEENPMIGYRGAMRYIKEPDLFALELEAIKTAREQFKATNLHLMIPFVRTVDELLQIKELLAKAGLKNDGKNFKLWIMVEVPSTVFLIDKFCEAGIDGVSIGSNDLTQLTLGVDRDNGDLAESFDERNEAVSMAMHRVVSITKKYGITCSICGNAASTYPEVVELLVRAGTTSVSVTPDVVIQTRKLIASIEKKIMLER